MMLVEIFAKHPEVTAPEVTELFTLTGTHSGALVRYAEGKSPPKYSTNSLHILHSQI